MDELIRLLASEDTDRLDSVCRKIVDLPGRQLSGMALAMVSGGKIVHEGYFGTRLFARGEGERDLPVDSRTRWRVASVSKTTVALAAMRLSARGLLDLDRDVSDYLGFSLRNPNYSDTALTVRMMLGHTSSLRDADFYYPPLGHAIRELFVPGYEYFDSGRHFAKPEAGTDNSPGNHYSYCNLGYGVLGTIIEKITGTRFDLFMRDEIFEPLGIDASFNPALISDTRFGDVSPIYRKGPADSETWDPSGPWVAQVDDYRGVKPRLPVRVPRGEGTPIALEDYVPGENGALFSPQGGLRICARDLARIVIHFLDSGETLAEMMNPGWIRDESGSNSDTVETKVFATGMGLMRSEGPDGKPGLWGHHGNAYGFLGGMYFDPERNCGYVFMIGGTGADPEKNRGSVSGLFVWEEYLRRTVEEILAPNAERGAAPIRS